MIGLVHHFGVVLHDQHGVAERLQIAQRFDQPFVVARVQADRWFVEHVASADQSARASVNPTEEVMAEVVVIGAGLSGTLMAYELLPQLRQGDRLSVISQGAVITLSPRIPGWRSDGASKATLRSTSSMS